MSLWRNIRAEMAGAWRSLRYDLGRRPAGRGPAEPDVTSTGMNTFPGSLVFLPAEPAADEERPPRRFVAVAVFCALAVCGAVGAYLVATTAFAGRMTDPPAAAPEVAPPPPRPPTFEAAPGPRPGGHAGMGRTPRRPHAVSPTPAAVLTTTTRVVVTPPPARENTRPATPVTEPPECDCDTPPVPTPTVPDPTASTSASPSGSTGPDPDFPGTPSPAGSAWTAPSDSHHHRLPW
ncbi:hypothetical protein Q0Z83_072580 [Actinoplanes sichuanensis]|nr:hypothetical protein Q0Z83_072580 [Actinoplanes sichuanensis]